MTLRSRVVSTLLIAFVLACGHALGASEVRAWDWFRAENGNVREGNERLRASDAAGALRSYELAARELPSDPGVHLNRGLALLALDQHDKAREAFLLATEPPASAPIRAAAYYDLGLAFYRQADAAATAAGADAVAQGGAIPGALPGSIPGMPPGGLMPSPGAPTGPAGGAVAGGGAPPPQADHREAQRLFREAADGFRRSLRIVPGNRDAAWNLELALRRLREEEEQQRQEDEQRRAEQEQQQQQQDQQAQNDPNQPPQDGQDGDPQQDQPPQDQPPQDGQDGDQQQQPGDQQQPDQPPQNQPPQDQQAQNDANQPQPQPGEENGDEGGQRDQGQDSPQGDGLPGDVARVLDALRDGEDNLERYRARARALRENRAPAQDW